jgi:IS30 family transposase
MSDDIKSGRPEVTLDWKKIDYLLEAGCSGGEIAAQCGVHHDTIYRRVQQRYGESFTDYAARIRQKGEANIRVVQYQKALKGDNNMLIWLGKNRLKQRDKEEVEAQEQQKIVFEVNYGNGNQVEILPKAVPASDLESA